MQTIKIKSGELAQMPKLGRGACSTVYKYGADLVIKVLNDKGIELHNEEEFSNLIGIENSTCIFPKNRVEIDGNFQGYTTDYVQGEPLRESIKRIDLITLISAIKQVESDLMQLASEKVLFQDLNQGGIMWDSANGRIKIIDTDFFIKNKSAESQRCYNHNIKSFNTMIEMELGILNGQDTKLLEYLMGNEKYSELYQEYLIASLMDENRSVTELITKAVELFENDFGVKINTIEEMQQLIGERAEVENLKEIPIFEPPKENEADIEPSKIGIKQKIANFFANKPLLRKIPFIDRFVLREQNLLPEKTRPEKDIRTEHDIFVAKLSDNGKYKDMPLGQQIKVLAKDTIETTREQFRRDIEERKKLEPHSITDTSRIEMMKKKMEGRSLDDE